MCRRVGCLTTTLAVRGAASVVRSGSRKAGCSRLERLPLSIRKRRAGFSLVELLVVISIVGVLVALLMPAVQAARESARRTHCSNNLKQVGLGYLQHHDLHGHFPTGGWGLRWVGDADRGFGRRQPGGWAFHILPYLEQGSLRDSLSDGRPDEITSQQLEAATAALQVPLPWYCCPSRRAPRLRRDWADTIGGYINAVSTAGSTSQKLDYAGNWGSVWIARGSVKGPSSLADGDRGVGFNPYLQRETCTGIVYQLSQVRIAHVVDGASQTYMVGEKNVNPYAYDTGKSKEDVGSAFTGLVGTCDGQHPPARDTDQYTDVGVYGSAHADSWGMCFADGSVRRLSYAMDPEIHRQMSSIDDGLPLGTVE